MSLYFAYFVLYSFFFIVGSVIGSFLNVLIYRIPRKINPCKGRSFCPSCNHQLKAIDLVPVFSWLFLGRKCRYCKNVISYRYPLVEMLGGILALLSIVVLGFSLEAVIFFVTSCILLTVAYIDWDTMEIPDGLILSLLVPGVCAVFLIPDISIISRLIGLFVISVPMFIMNLIISDSFGGGDIKLCFFAGFLLGWQNMIVAAFIALVLGGIYGIYLLLTKKKGKKDHFAFGPFLSIGLIISLLCGKSLINSYLSLFF